MVALTLLWEAPVAVAELEAGRPTDNLYSTRFVDAANGWAAGAFGTIEHSSDGGKTWRRQASHTYEHLYSVDFVDGLHGWVTGRNGMALHTSDAGETWQQQTTGVERHLFSVHALDTQRVWAVGDWGAILATRDGGRTWENRSLERDVILNSQSWPASEHGNLGWIVGEAGTLLATNDGGGTWTDQQPGTEKTLFGVCFADARNGWATGLDGLILHTTDGGETWAVQHGEAQVGALEQVGTAAGLENPSLYDIAVVGAYGYAAGEGGAVFISRDSGTTWTRAGVPAAANLRWIRGLSLVSGTHGMLVGANGLALRVVGDELSLSGN